jgi:hypothetical protein
MFVRPEYPIASIFERAAYAVLACATGVGLLVAVVAALQSQIPEPVAAIATPAVVASR